MSMHREILKDIKEIEVTKYTVEYEYETEEGIKKDEIDAYITESEIEKRMEEDELERKEAIMESLKRFVNKWAIQDIKTLKSADKKENINLEL